MTPLAQPMTRMFPWKNHEKIKEPLNTARIFSMGELMGTIYIYTRYAPWFSWFPWTGWSFSVAFSCTQRRPVDFFFLQLSGTQWNQMARWKAPSEMFLAWSPKCFHTIINPNQICLVTSTSTGWWYTYPSEKYESQLGWLFPTEWKVIKFHGSKPPTR